MALSRLPNRALLRQPLAAFPGELFRGQRGQYGASRFDLVRGLGMSYWSQLIRTEQCLSWNIKTPY